MNRLAIVAFSILAAVGCTDSQTAEPDETLTFDDPIEAISFDLEGGAFTVQIVEGSEVSVARTEVWNSAEPTLSATVIEGILTLTMTCDAALVLLCGVDHVVTIPRSMAVEGSTGDGLITLVDLTSDIDVFSGSGAISLQNLSGNVIAGTGSGRIDAVGLSSASVEASTGSGAIDVILSTIPSVVELGTGSGRVDLVVPGGEYQLDLSSGAGAITTSGVQDVAASGSTITIDTGSGAIDVQGF